MDRLQLVGKIREQMLVDGVDAYIVPISDPHINEYLPDYYQSVAFLSGFTGSAGTLVITSEFADLWTDARYFEQANQELVGSGFKLVKLKVPHTPEYIGWLAQRLSEEAVIAFDFLLMPLWIGDRLAASLSHKNIHLQSIDYIGQLWLRRPELPKKPAQFIPDNAAGYSIKEKMGTVRRELRKKNCTYLLLSALDEIAWLLNMRGNDIPFNPVVISFLLISNDDALLFVHPEKIDENASIEFNRQGIQIAPYEQLMPFLEKLNLHETLWVDPRRTAYFVTTQRNRLNLRQEESPVSLLKALKNDVEIRHIREAVILDGIALVRFFTWLEKVMAEETLNEYEAAERITDYRQLASNCISPSFRTIAGYQTNAALPHYIPSAERNVLLQNKGLFLLDSGGQYRYGTTDVTRTVSCGINTEEECTDFTLVLKALIAGSSLRFPHGTCGYQLDAVVRNPLWAAGINYGHGTGHGVGYLLNVHEGPQSISPANNPQVFHVGMVTSIEPGIYRPGRHGVRLENLVLTVQDEETEFGSFLRFETLTLAPIDIKLIKKELLTKHEIDWVNQYHQEVYAKLAPFLGTEETTWLFEKTIAI